MSNAGVKRTEPMTVAFLSTRGAYGQVPEGFDRLYGFASAHGLIPTGSPHAVYLTPPELPEAEAAWELWAPVAAPAETREADEHGLGVKEVPGKTVAWVMHMGPYETIAPTYEGLMRWIAENGHVISGPPEEIYFSDPDQVPAEEYLTEVQIPIDGA